MPGAQSTAKICMSVGLRLRFRVADLADLLPTGAGLSDRVPVIVALSVAAESIATEARRSCHKITARIADLAGSTGK